MVASYNSSIAPGTAANRRKQAYDYIKFALIYNVPFLQPSVTHVCMYAQRLANKHEAPASIKNYLSGAKTWVTEHQGDISSFCAPQLSQLVKGFAKNSTQIPSRATPLSSADIQAICRFLDNSPSFPLALKPAILIGYSCFLRSSNILSPTMSQWGGPHTMMARDIRINEAGLSIFIRSTKTLSAPSGVTFQLPACADRRLCPAAAWRLYKEAVNRWALGPAFIHMNRLPITPGQLVAAMRAALKDVPGISVGSVSMHSLRRGAVHTAVERGLPLDEIKTRGTWKSNAGVRPYLLPSHSSVTIPVSNLAI